MAKYSMKELLERKAFITVYDDATKAYVDARVIAVKFPGVEVQIGKKKAVIAALALPWLRIAFATEVPKTRRSTLTSKAKAGAGRRGR